MFIGAGPKWSLVETALQSEHLPNVTLLPWQDEAVIPYSLATADVALVSLEPGMEGLAIPSKAIYAMAAGSKIVVLAENHNELNNWLRIEGDNNLEQPPPAKRLNDLLSGLLHSKNSVLAQQHTRELAVQKFQRKLATNRLYHVLRTAENFDFEIQNAFQNT